MPAYKSHHYVPQMYMRLFSRPGEDRIGVYVIDSGKFIPGAPIRGQACRDYFYGKDPRAEKLLGELEGAAAKIFDEATLHHRLPAPDSEGRAELVLYLGMQHSRTVGAAEQHDEGSEKLAKAVLRRKAEMEGNERVVAALDRVRIRRTNGVSELLGYASIGSSLLADLSFVLLLNESELPFLASDTPVALHNRLYEGQAISVTGYGNVGLQLFLPLGPRLALFGFDGAAYAVRTGVDGHVAIADADQIRAINHLQWEAAHKVLLLPANMAAGDLRSDAAAWSRRRSRERTVYREEVIAEADGEIRTRHGSGQVASTVALDLPFVVPRLAKPALLGLFEIPPFRDPERIARIDRLFALFDT